MGNVPMASTGMLRARSVPKQSSRGNKGFLRNVISYMLLCYSDRCTRALTRCSADEGTKLKGRERSPLVSCLVNRSNNSDGYTGRYSTRAHNLLLRFYDRRY
jgi:hypothetical protein